MTEQAEATLVSRVDEITGLLGRARDLGVLARGADPVLYGLLRKALAALQTTLEMGATDEDAAHALELLARLQPCLWLRTDVAE
jgi:hypothetical protein